MATDICAICREDLTTDIYIIPECSHKYHTNCLVTWFRCGHNRCPLCNDQGINATNSIGVENSSWYARQSAIENYKRLRCTARGKDAPKELKKKVGRLKVSETKLKVAQRERAEFLQGTHPDLTGREIIARGRKFRRQIRGFQRRIRRMKLVIGYRRPTPIIIPIKREVGSATIGGLALDSWAPGSVH